MSNKTQNNPRVSVVCISYNQEDYIEEALVSICSQTYPNLEVIICDDASTDKTQEKILKIIEPYKSQINFKLKLRKKNIGIESNLYNGLSLATGDYVALCEGDDFWIDKNKLQTQISYMEKNTDTAVCFHKVKIFFENNQEEESYWPPEDWEFTVKALLERNFIQTNTVLYRRQDYTRLKKGVMPWDWYLNLFHAQFGNIHFIDKVMSAYRRHEGGIWWDEYTSPYKIFIKYGMNFLALNDEMLKMFGNNPKYIGAVNDRVYDNVRRLTQIDIDHGTGLVAEVVKKYPEFIGLYSRRALVIANKYEPLLILKNTADKEVKSLKGELAARHSMLVELNKQIEYYRNRLELIEGSRTWRLRNKIARVFRKSNEGGR